MSVSQYARQWGRGRPWSVVALPNAALPKPAYDEALVQRHQLVRSILRIILIGGIPLQAAIALNMWYEVWVRHHFPPLSFFNYLVTLIAIYGIGGLLIHRKHLGAAALLIVIAINIEGMFQVIILQDVTHFLLILPIVALESIVLASEVVSLVFILECIYIFVMAYVGIDPRLTVLQSPVFLTIDGVFVALGLSINRRIDDTAAILYARGLEAVERARLEEHNSVLQIIADHAVELETANHALHQANHDLHRSRQQAEDLAIEQERNRVARDIHDGLGHFLDEVNLHLGAAGTLWDADRETAHDSLIVAQHQVREARQELRRAISALRADYLASPIEDLLVNPIRVCQLAGIETHLHVAGSKRPLPEVIKQVLYRTTQEALNNVRKHAQARHATVYLDYGETNRMRLVVEDDGLGFPPDRSTGGRGLVGLRERVAAVNGLIKIESEIGQGYRIEVVVTA